MAATQAKHGYGATLKRGDGADPEVFTAVAEVKTLESPGFSMDVHDATHLNSDDAFREFVAGLIDAGEISGTLNYLPSDDTQDPTNGLLSDMYARALKNYEFGFPDGSKFTCACFVTRFGPGSVSNDGVVEAPFTLKVSGKPTFTEAS